MGILVFFYSLVCLLLIVSESFSSSSVMMHHVCSPTEAFALLHFKQSFQISDQPICWDETDLQYERYFDIPKTKSWNESRDCCSWDGITCDMLTGHVIGLDLSCSRLNGTIHLNSSLFQLYHLRTLNLAYNDFYSSSIPHNIGRLTNLRHLNLSYSLFEGEIPTEISYLSNLVSLELDCDECELDEKTFETMLQNFTNLEVVSLYGVNISSPLPVNISSSSLRYVDLGHTNLGGVLTESFFLLPHLEKLYLYENDLLKGVLPKIHPSNTLLELDISYTGISGELPDSIGTLSSLNILVMYGCQLSGRIPDSVGNLTQIRYLDFGNNHFTGHIPSTISKLKQLTFLGLSSNSFSGEIPDIFSNLQELRYLYLRNNSFIGSFPSTIVSLTQLQRSYLSSNSLSGQLPNNMSMLQKLTLLDLSYNSLNGTIPSSVFGLPLLSSLSLQHNQFSGLDDEFKTNPTFKHLDLSHNQLSGSLLQSLSNLTNLSTLVLSSNNITVDAGIQITFPSLEDLLLSSCELKDFPYFLTNVKKLQQCGTSDLSHVPQPLESEDESYFFRGFTWESVVIGYSCGLVAGTVVWSLMFKYRKPEWFVEFFEGIYPKKMRRSMKRAQRRRT
ncbi:hypothetical protein H5410_058994 [Solanum commersonii]|uniref:Leucine-rich repeat-containing N-terminal plant-type domain-containing protein n=1 Tax=Solanum commersonii TaxID=4109 RepID=A0A9J5W1M1_SOLCO|nr:hypothetical protein H5410_058994 [Solanum commersonii]